MISPEGFPRAGAVTARVIDAPQTGMAVQKVPMNTGSYAQNADGAVRP